MQAVMHVAMKGGLAAVVTASGDAYIADAVQVRTARGTLSLSQHHAEYLCILLIYRIGVSYGVTVCVQGKAIAQLKLRHEEITGVAFASEGVLLVSTDARMWIYQISIPSLSRKVTNSNNTARS